MGMVPQPKSQSKTPRNFFCARKKLSIHLDTYSRKEQDHLEVSLFAAKFPHRSPNAVSVKAKFRIKHKVGRT
jgi:hypothetical protein